MSQDAASEEDSKRTTLSELQPEAMWIKIQQNTFTRWVNQQLKGADMQIQDLETDFEEGLKLIRLVEILSGKSLGKYSKKVTFRSQKLENISLALNFLEREEKIKLVNIDSSAIADRNLKLIMGLIWTLILHYSIAQQIWDELPEEAPQELTPKQKLMVWIKAKLPSGLPLNNFTSDWNDGVLLGALVDSCIPDLHLNWREWVPVNALDSTRTAMQIASDKLDVVPLITAEELINPAVDEKSVMTYLAQFPQAKYHPPLGYIEGLDSFPFISAISTFTLRTANGSAIPSVTILGPSGTPLEVNVEKSSSTVYIVKYQPKEVGEHQITVNVKDEATNTSAELPIQKFSAIRGAELVYEPSGRIGQPSKLRVNNAEDNELEIIVVDPQGTEAKLELVKEDDSVLAEFTPKIRGSHSIHVLYRKKHISGSPFALTVQASLTFEIWGRGIAEEGIRVGDEVSYVVDANTPCASSPEVSVLDPANNPLSVVETVDEKKQRFTYTYKPQMPGNHKIEVKYLDEHVEKSPFKVLVEEPTSCAVRAFGPGLRGGIAKQPGVFYVETKGETDRLGFSIESPCKTDITCTDNGNGSAVVQYSPDEPGIYMVNIYSNDKHIKDSPFVFMVEPAAENLNPQAAKLIGLDANSTISVNDHVTFTIDTTACGGDATPVVNVYDMNLTPIPVDISEKSKGIYECVFQPESAGRHYIDAAVFGVAIMDTPFVLNVKESFDASAIRLSGPGLEEEIRTKQTTHFTVDLKDVGKGNQSLDIQLIDPKGVPVDIVVDNNDGIYTVEYTALLPGVYEAKLCLGGKEIAKREILVKPSADMSSIRIEGLQDEEVLLGHCKEIRLDMGSAFTPDEKLQVITEDSDGQKFILKLNQESTNVFTGRWVAQKIGKTKFSVLLDDALVCSSTTTVREGEDASKCRAIGDGLERAYVNQPAKFRIDTQGAGEGSVAMTIKGPSESKTSVTDHSNGSCTVEYLPQLPGLYEINITFGEKKIPIPGSPFIAKVDYPCDPTQVIVKDFVDALPIGAANSFTIDASHTAEAPVEVHIPEGQEQPKVEEIEPRVYKVTHALSGQSGDVVPVTIFYDGRPILKRQVTLRAPPGAEPGRVQLKDYSGGSFPADVVASLPAHFLLDVAESDENRKLAAEVKGPDGKLRKSFINATPDPGMYSVNFTPDIIGVYDIKIFLNDLCISKSPFKVRAIAAGDANKCIIKDLPAEEYWAAGETKVLAVDTSEAGHGALSILPSREQEVEYSINQQMGSNNQLVYIKPLTTGPHIIDLLFGGQNIPNGTLRFECVPPSQLKTLPQTDETLCSRTPEFNEIVQSEAKEVETFKFVVTPELEIYKLVAVVTTPSGKADNARIQDNHDGTVSVIYRPVEYGEHQLAIQHNGVNITGSPMSFFVDDINGGTITLYGPGLFRAVVGEPATFIVCSKGPTKELSVAVEGIAKATIKCHDNKDGTCSVAWIPPVPGEYKIHVNLAGKPVKNSPFTVFVAGEGLKRAHLSIGSTSEVSLNVSAPELKGLSASIKSPSGIEEPCYIRQIDATHIGVSFTPREAGDHWITVKCNGMMIPKSPFRVKVDKSQVGDASKVIVTGNGRANAICQEFNDITVDTRNAGYGGLSVSIEGPSKCELNCKEAKDGLISLAYRPTEPGTYLLSVKFADSHVEGSPFTVNCTGKGIGAVVEKISKEVSQASTITPGQDAALFLQLPNTSPMEMTAKVMNPKGISEDVEIKDLGENYYQIRFRPEMEGSHAVSVFCKDQHVNGSPFLFTVGPFEEGGAYKVRAGGLGLLRAETNYKQSFNLYTREAGTGRLTVTIEGPSKAEMEFKEHKDGNCHVDYTVTAPGIYVISIKFNDDHIPDSPFKVFVTPSVGEARRLELASFPDFCMPEKQFDFVVLTHGAPGHLEAKVQTPSNKIETIDVVHVDETDSYALCFIPHETGNYYIDILLDGVPMRGSPFRLRVGSREENDPTAITVSGDGIRRGKTGRKCEFVVNTCNAGSGLLQVQIDGPSKVTLDAYELEMGYKVRYMALLPGVYYAAIKYSGVHIPGSPFKINIDGDELGAKGEPDTVLIKIDALAKVDNETVASVPVFTGDANKVVVKGDGLSKFSPGRAASFNIETGLAGANLLFVGVVTTKGPCEELSVKHNGGGNFNVEYRIQESAKGFIFVKYGDKEVPGSPFPISY